MIGAVTPGTPAVGSLMPRKTIVLEDLLLDPNDDLQFCLTLAQPQDESVKGGQALPISRRPQTHQDP